MKSAVISLNNIHIHSQALALHVIMGVPFPFLSKLLVGLQNVNNTNTFSEVISCLRF